MGVFTPLSASCDRRLRVMWSRRFSDIIGLLTVCSVSVLSVLCSSEKTEILEESHLRDLTRYAKFGLNMTAYASVIHVGMSALCRTYIELLWRALRVHDPGKRLIAVVTFAAHAALDLSLRMSYFSMTSQALRMRMVLAPRLTQMTRKC